MKLRHRNRAKRLLKPVMPVLQRLRWGRANPIEGWRLDSRFRSAHEEIEDLTLVDCDTAYVLYQAVSSSIDLVGDVAEVGVYRGGTARLIARALEGSGKTLHLFDTFSGMPEVDSQVDYHRKDDFADTSVEAVERVLQGLGKYRLHPGCFPESAAGLSSTVFCFAHIDVDIYRSVIDACRFFWPRLAAGGAILFDDYGHVSCRGAKKAVDEFFASSRCLRFYIPTGQYIAVKTQAAEGPPAE